MKEIKYTISYCVCENFCDSILLRFITVPVPVLVPLWSVMKLQFWFRYGEKLRILQFRFRFRFRNTGLGPTLESPHPPHSISLPLAGLAVRSYICKFTQADRPPYPTVSVLPTIHNCHAFSALHCSYSNICSFIQDDSPPPTVSVMPTIHNVHAFSALYCSYIPCPSPFIPGFLFYSKIRKYHVCLFFTRNQEAWNMWQLFFGIFPVYFDRKSRQHCQMKHFLK